MSARSMQEPPGCEPGKGPREARLRAIEQTMRTMPERYLGADPGFDATYHLRLTDIGRTYELRCTETALRVRTGVSAREPDVVLTTDSDTWTRLRDGEINGLQAFLERKLHSRGNLDLAVALESLFRLPDGREPRLRLRRVDVGGGRAISTLTLGEGSDVVLIHGLGSAKSSFLELAALLAGAGHRVHAIDLPGFGSSSKPTLAPYTARWFADNVLRLLDALGIDAAHLVGNSMGGRVSLEVALRAPGRVLSVGALCPAVAFIKRDLHPLVRLLRPELTVFPHRISRRLIERQLWSLFADPSKLDPAVADVIIDEFQRIYGSAGARVAFAASARNIYLDRPFGRDGFYPRLSELEVPALFVWGTEDPLIPAAFARHVRRALPTAEQIVLEGCGHVPQVERAQQTAGMLRRLFVRAELRPRVAGRAA